MEKINKLKKFFKSYNLDGYIIPKNNNFFGEYIPTSEDNLKYISNFTGSAGFAVILKNKNYMFVDGRYTIQAEMQCGKEFQICNIPKEYPFSIFKKKSLNLGFDPKLHTENSLSRLFDNNFIKLKPVNKNLIDLIWKRQRNSKTKPFYLIDDQDAGLQVQKKLNKLLKVIKAEKADYLFTTASENVAWLLNIRGSDNPNSPIPNCHLLLDKKNNLFLISKKNKVSKLIKEKKLKSSQIIDPKDFKDLILNLNGKRVIIDIKTCSVFYENILKEKFKLLKKEDPIYLLKSIKNKKEIKNMVNSHIIDGVALTKFIYWIKNVNKKKISEVQAQNKLERFRKMNKNYLYPSFDTIAVSGKN